MVPYISHMQHASCTHINHGCSVATTGKCLHVGSGRHKTSPRNAIAWRGMLVQSNFRLIINVKIFENDSLVRPRDPCPALSDPCDSRRACKPNPLRDCLRPTASPDPWPSSVRSAPLAADLRRCDTKPLVTRAVPAIAAPPVMRHTVARARGSQALRRDAWRRRCPPHARSCRH